LFELLASSGLQHILQANGWPTAMEEEQEQLANEDDDLSDEDFMPIFRNRLRARRSTERVTLPPVPNPEGKKLMGEGHFGTDHFYGDRLRQRKKFLATSLMWRELGIDTDGVRKRASQSISQVG
jgi:WD repeat-containing protein 23